ncbi:DUF4124 domain-containing protein [Exilibacterium tricleocarpae]|uniref:DUF4124 domain-containing protein n=1 Tax=Exilibacterium tricleocarpae TaxID=2591008 RepID=A0A545SNY9_9GAMM|nr:DUF4124 domain-containing protein [Exilibacterium tricleocarpae]TQV66700.1 DUF4124 domain-containing protein [Exilibacterium tricleocarpae]
MIDITKTKKPIAQKSAAKHRRIQPGVSLLGAFCVALAITLAPPSLAGKLYKIVDENGKVTFSQFPPKEKADTDKVEDIAVKTTGSEKLAVQTRAGIQYCGDIRLTDRRNSTGTDNTLYLSRRLEEWRERTQRYEADLEQLSNRQFDRSTNSYARHESSTQKNNRYKQYQASHERALQNLRQYRCAVDWAEGQLKGDDGREGLASINKEVDRLRGVHDQLEAQLYKSCGPEPLFDPTTAQGKEKTRRWEACAKNYKTDMQKVRNKIRNASVNARY